MTCGLLAAAVPAVAAMVLTNNNSNTASVGHRGLRLLLLRRLLLLIMLYPGPEVLMRADVVEELLDTHQYVARPMFARAHEVLYMVFFICYVLVVAVECTEVCDEWF